MILRRKEEKKKNKTKKSKSAEKVNRLGCSNGPHKIRPFDLEGS
jgi:hypothetical protein